MSDDEIAPEMLARLGINAIAMLWAQEFNKTAIKLGYSEMDEGWLTCWFANAIENCDMMRRNPLRADLAAVTAERDRMMKALAPFVDAAHFSTRAETAATAENNLVSIQIKESSIGRARAALEGVTEKSGAGSE